MPLVPDNHVDEHAPAAIPVAPAIHGDDPASGDVAWFMRVVETGNEDFAKRVHTELGDRGRHRESHRVDTAWTLRDPIGGWFA